MFLIIFRKLNNIFVCVCALIGLNFQAMCKNDGTIETSILLDLKIK